MSTRKRGLSWPGFFHVKILAYLMAFFTIMHLFFSSDHPYLPSEKTNNSCIFDSSIRTGADHFNETRINSIDSETQLHHIVFGIGASSRLWEKRKEYIRQWWRPNVTRGYAWLDKPVEADESLPEVKVSSDTSRLKYTHGKGHRSALRISRIVSETVRLGLEGVRWIVLGDDDTFFVTENLVRVLSKYDHNGFYYIGSNSESHVQNVEHFSYGMAYGGGGFAVSYGLAEAVEKMQDGCMERYPHLYGSDDRMHACMAELGVPLTKQVGFHQLDIYGDPLGFLSAHPIAPLVSLHHLDVIHPIFPNVGQAQALERLKMPMKLDSAGLMQQAICYDKIRNWTVSVSWGYSAQIYRAHIPVRDVERPIRTFLDWYGKDDGWGLTFNTRPLGGHPCDGPLVYVLSNAVFDIKTNQTASEYVRFSNSKNRCGSTSMDPSDIDRVQVYKKPNPRLWDKPPRRNCCRVMAAPKEGTVAVDIHECREGETIEA